MKEQIVEINEKNIFLLENFISNMGSSNKTFRYFQKRSLDCIKNHLLCCVLLKDGQSIAYGHLDQDGKNIWLGVCVIEKQTGCGYGKKIMSYLTNFAKSNNLQKIRLSVDKNNHNAINMYISFGFIEKSRTNNFIFMEKELING